MRTARHAAAALTLLVAYAAGCAAPDPITSPLAPRASAATLIAPPPAGAASGVSIDGAPLGKPGLSAWDSWTSLVGKRASYVMWFSDWSTSYQGYAVTNAYGRNAVPIVTWEMKNRQTAIRYADVLGGRWNKYLDTWASAVKADGRPVFVRFAHEMNGDWYGWSGAQNGASSAAAQQFVATWKYVHDRFARAGVTNVTWVWCPNHESVPDAPWNTPESYYPGDDQVDWVCADGYNWGTSQTMANAGWVSHWQTFDEIFGPIYARLAALAPGKPVMIGEFASSEAGGSKAAWIADAASRIRGGQYPWIRAFVWFNYDKETDWRVESSAASLDAFRRSFVGDAYYVWR